VAEVDELQEALEREYPRLDERNGDWHEVVRRAQVAPPRRRRWTLRVAVAGVALAALTIALVAPWHSDNGIVGRAAAAIGDGPVIHVVVRANTKARRVDLRTGKSRPAYEEQELWWDPERGLHTVARFDGKRYRDTLSRTLPKEDPLVRGFVTGYRDALESGEAKVIGNGEINGHEVTWIRFYPYGGSTTMDPRMDVAIDRESAKPVFTRYTPGGEGASSSERAVLLAESLPRGSGDFDVKPTPPLNGPIPPPDGGAGFGFGDPITPGRARAILGKTPLWLGPRFRGDAFAGFQAAFEVPRNELKKRFDVGVETVYGSAVAPVPPRQRRWVRVGQYPRLLFDIAFMSPNESRIWRTARAGSLLVYEGGEGEGFSLPGAPLVSGYTRQDGLYVKIISPNRDAIVPAARALRLYR
jgi:hypothetical protein